MDLEKIFEELKSILKKYERKLVTVKDQPGNYYLNTPASESNKEEFFGATQIKKNYVSFHLMPIYCFPSLADEISEELRKKMQGKSCFNFKKLDDELFRQLAELTKKSIELYIEKGKVK